MYCHSGRQGNQFFRDDTKTMDPCHKRAGMTVTRVINRVLQNSSKEKYVKKLKSWLISLLKYRYGIIKPRPLDNFPLEHIKKVVILIQERIGDTILTTPLLKNWRHEFPHMEIDLVGVRDDNEILRDDPHINHFYNLNRLSAREQSELFKRKYDLLFNSKDHASFTFLSLSRKIKARLRVGIEHPQHLGNFHYLLPQAVDTATVEKNCSILSLMGNESWKKDLTPYFNEGPVTPEIEKFAADKIQTGEVIGINLSASNIYKSWKIENYREFLENINQKVIVFSLPEKEQQKESLEKEFTRVIPTPRTPTIQDVAYLVRRLKVLISPDTSLIHLASCYNVPVVALYRTELDYKRFPPYSHLQRVLVSRTELTDDIPPQDVYEAYLSLMK
ncbi:MAG: glycosyltransferase family 9 protein [Calditrichia bacterium]|nr:glycosyltransferase family 9 protein [Calditrichia bacterium]